MRPHRLTAREIVSSASPACRSAVFPRPECDGLTWFAGRRWRHEKAVDFAQAISVQGRAVKCG